MDSVSSGWPPRKGIAQRIPASERDRERMEAACQQQGNSARSTAFPPQNCKH